MRTRLGQFSSSSGVVQSAITIGGNFLSTGISAIALILVSRILGPESFGEFSVGFAIILILSRFNDAGFNATILKFVGNSQDHSFIRQTLLATTQIKLIFSLILVCLGIIFLHPISQLLDFSPTILLMAIIFSVLNTWYEQLLAALQALHRFTQAVLSNTIQATVKLLGILVLAVTTTTSANLIFAWYMVAPLATILAAPLLLPRWVFKLPENFLQIKVPHGLTAMAKHSAVGFITAGLIENLDLLFVQKYLNSYEVGLLSGVSRIAMMLTLVAYSLGNVLYPRVARYKSKTDLQPYLQKSFMVIALSVIGFLLFIPISTLLIRFTIGEAYLPGNAILLILMASSFMTLAVIPFLALFYTYEADWYFSVSGILQLVIVIVGNGFFVPDYGLEAAAWTKFGVRLFLLLFTAGLALIIYRQKYLKSEARI